MSELCPSILSADFNRLGEQIRTLEQEGVRVLHIDVMDGIFVPSISFGMPVIRSIRKESGMFFDVHLMVTEPIRYIREFADCGADSITVHLEACSDAGAAVRAIHDAGVKAGISIKPKTPAEEVRPYIRDVEMVLVMTVEPGFGGQKYDETCTAKIRRVREIESEEGASVHVQVDGGINDDTVRLVVEAGADWLVAGSSVFDGDLKKNADHLRALMQEAGAQ